VKTDELQGLVERVRAGFEKSTPVDGSDVLHLCDYVQADIDGQLLAGVDPGSPAGNVTVVLLVAAGGATLRLSVEEAQALWAQLDALFGREGEQRLLAPLAVPTQPWPLTPPTCGPNTVGKTYSAPQTVNVRA